MRVHGMYREEEETEGTNGYPSWEGYWRDREPLFINNFRKYFENRSIYLIASVLFHHANKYYSKRHFSSKIWFSLH